jgi:hypothetical protein
MSTSRGESGNKSLNTQIPSTSPLLTNQASSVFITPRSRRTMETIVKRSSRRGVSRKTTSVEQSRKKMKQRRAIFAGFDRKYWTRKDFHIYIKRRCELYLRRKRFYYFIAYCTVPIDPLLELHQHNIKKSFNRVTPHIDSYYTEYYRTQPLNSISPNNNERRSLDRLS